MLAAYLGLDKFRKGLNHYLTRHQYSNTLTKVLLPILFLSSLIFLSSLLFSSKTNSDGRTYGRRSQKFQDKTLALSWPHGHRWWVIPSFSSNRPRKRMTKKPSNSLSMYSSSTFPLCLLVLYSLSATYIVLARTRYLRTGVQKDEKTVWQIPLTIRVHYGSAEPEITRISFFFLSFYCIFNCSTNRWLAICINARKRTNCYVEGASGWMGDVQRQPDGPLSLPLPLFHAWFPCQSYWTKDC